MKKKLLMLLLILCFILSSSFLSFAYNENGILNYPTVKISVDDSCLNCGDGYNVNGTTYVPLRLVLETMGATVNWNKDDQSVVVTSNKSVSQTEAFNSIENTTESIMNILHQVENEIEFLMIVDSQIAIAAEAYKELNETRWIQQLMLGSMKERKNGLKQVNQKITAYQKENEHHTEANELTIYAKKLDDILTYQEIAITSLDSFSKTNHNEDYKNYLLHRKFALDIIEDLKEMINKKIAN